MDTHADTIAVGKGAYITQDTGHTVTVHPFATGLSTIKQVPIVTAALAYDCPATLQTYILFLHQSLYIERLTSHLICPAQLRANGVTVNDIPLVHMPRDQRKATDHSIITEGLHIPLKLDGVISYFDVRRPTQAEVTSDQDCIHVHLTNDSHWDPRDPRLSASEEALRATVTPVRGQDIRRIEPLLEVSPTGVLTFVSFIVILIII